MTITFFAMKDFQVNLIKIVHLFSFTLTANCQSY